MDIIGFRIVEQKYGYKNENHDLVEIFVNGKNFLDTVKEFDKSYSPIIPEYLYLDLIDGYKDDFITIYDCGCGCSGCDPFCVFVDVGEKIFPAYKN